MKSNKTLLPFLSIAFAILLLTNICSCSNKKEFTVKGTVQEIQFGKDGYTAIVNSNDVVYDAVISRVTLGDAYKELKTGDIVTLSGDTMQLNGRTHIHVSKISY